MTCPKCKQNDDRVLDSRSNQPATAIRRRRECNLCGYRFTSYEKIEEKPLIILKKDGHGQLFDKEKLRRGISISLRKRPITATDLENTLNAIEDSAEQAAHESRELSSEELGEMVLKHLYHLDKVAYIRFASVYRAFEDLEEFKNEIDLVHEK